MDAMNLRAPRYWIARATEPCAQCGACTPVFALAVPAGHERLEEQESEAAEAAVPRWEVAGEAAWLFHVSWVSAAVAARLAACAPGYRLAPGETDPGPCWRNHCAGCGAPVADHELFCEPEGAFLPLTESAACAIEWWPIDEPLQAAAAGWAGDAGDSGPAGLRAGSGV